MPVALITGAARGIGRAVARDLLTRGHRVLAVDHDAPALAELTRGFDSPTASRCVVETVDVADETQVEHSIATLARHFGRLDLLVNNAGMADPFNGPIESLALADWNRVIGVNLTGYFLFAKHATPLLRESRGAIVNMASSRAYQSEPQSEAYAASKGGIVALTHALAISLGPDMRVNAVAPGWIDVRDQQPEAQPPAALRAVDHAQHPVGRVGAADDIAALVSFLASPATGFISGQTLTADGGMTRRMIYEH